MKESLISTSGIFIAIIIYDLIGRGFNGIDLIKALIVSAIGFFVFLVLPNKKNKEKQHQIRNFAFQLLKIAIIVVVGLYVAEKFFHRV